MPDQPSPQPSPTPPPQEPKEEKLEFLKREEVRTMAKDIARVREGEAKTRQERIAGLKLREGKTSPKPQVALSQQGTAKPGKAPATGPVPAKRAPSRFEKVFVRIVIGGIIFFLLFNAVAFGVWLFWSQNQEPQAPQEKTGTVEETTEPAPEPAQEEEPVSEEEPTAAQ